MWIRRRAFYTTASALCGCCQTELAEEDQPLTTFITPYGRFRYRRGPIGFAATGDAFYLPGDVALQGVMKCVKVVDDILLYDEDYSAHLHRVHEVLSRCRKDGMALNADKFVLGRTRSILLWLQPLQGWHSSRLREDPCHRGLPHSFQPH